MTREAVGSIPSKDCNFWIFAEFRDIFVTHVSISSSSSGESVKFSKEFPAIGAFRHSASAVLVAFPAFGAFRQSAPAVLVAFTAFVAFPHSGPAISAVFPAFGAFRHSVPSF